MVLPLFDFAGELLLPKKLSRRLCLKPNESGISGSLWSFSILPGHRPDDVDGASGKDVL